MIGGLFTINSHESKESPSMDEEVDDVIIFDNGSSEHRAGFCGETNPRVCFPSVVGHSQVCTSLLSGLGSWYVGEDVISRQSSPLMDVLQPVQDGVIVDWEAMEELWSYSMKEKLKVHPEEHVVLHALKADASKKQRENIAEIMFETFGVNGCSLVSDASLALVTANRTTGLVVDCGHNSCSVTPVYESFAIPAISTRTQMSYNKSIEYLTKVLAEDHGYLHNEADDVAKKLLHDYSFIHTSETNHCISDILTEELLGNQIYNSDSEGYTNNISQRLLHKLSFIEKQQSSKHINKSIHAMNTDSFHKLTLSNASLSTKQIQNKSNQGFIYLKNGIKQSLDNACEALFSPKLIDSKEKSLQSIVIETLNNCDTELQKEMLQNIVITGASSQIKGLSQRLYIELMDYFTEKDIINITNVSQPNTAVWRGGSLFASNAEFENMIVLRTEYDEIGPIAAQRKCFM